jgi:hypothetical protein
MCFRRGRKVVVAAANLMPWYLLIVHQNPQKGLVET